MPNTALTLTGDVRPPSQLAVKQEKMQCQEGCWPRNVRKVVNNRATHLLSRPAHQRSALPELTETDFRRWATIESLTLARTEGYRNGAVQGSTNENDSELLPADYAAQV